MIQIICQQQIQQETYTKLKSKYFIQIWQNKPQNILYPKFHDETVHNKTDQRMGTLDPALSKNLVSYPWWE